MRTSEAVDEVSASLVKACASIDNPRKTARADVGTFGYDYAPLDVVVSSVRGSLADNGLTVVQDAVTSDNGNSGVVTRIVHTSGQWIEYGPLYMPSGNTAQTHGSAISYARRYSLLAALGLAAEDDDGRSAGVTTETAAPAVVTPETSGNPTPTSASGGASANGDGASMVPPGAHTFDDLKRAAGSAAKARELVNSANDTAYTPGSIKDATPAELKLALATLQEGAA